MENEDRTHSIAPVWFEEDKLKGQHFNSEPYITDLTRYVPLEAICTQLEIYFSQLKLEVSVYCGSLTQRFVASGGDQ